jgi:hypothetical protein
MIKAMERCIAKHEEESQEQRRERCVDSFQLVPSPGLSPHCDADTLDGQYLGTPEATCSHVSFHQDASLMLTWHVSRTAVAAYTAWVCGLSSGPPGSLLVYFSANVHQGADRQVRTNRRPSSSAGKNGAMAA